MNSTQKLRIEFSTDYYPFGQPMPERNFNEVDYRFGFNGVEKDNEITGSDGAHYEFKFREYDSRIGRFWKVDPLFKDYPWNSSYAFAENDVIRAIDLEGMEKYIVNLYYQNDKLVGFRVKLNMGERKAPADNPSLGPNYTLYNIFKDGVVSISEFAENTFDPNVIYTVGDWSGVVPQQEHITELNSGYRTKVKVGQVPNHNMISLTNFFKTDKDQIVAADLIEGQQGIEKLDNIAKYVIANNINVSITGHTDNMPSNKYPTGNIGLSEERARSVATYLISKGVSTQQILTIVGRGESQPVNYHETPTPDAANRRVEIQSND